jgi:hypothetical protein
MFDLHSLPRQCGFTRAIMLSKVFFSELNSVGITAYVIGIRFEN